MAGNELAGNETAGDDTAGNETAGRLDAIWIKRSKRGLMDPSHSAILEADRGIKGNANRGGRRQVTVIDAAKWRTLMDQLGGDTDPSARRANLMVTGITLANTRGRILKVGSCRIEIMGETRPCERMDEALPGLREAMKEDWGGGVFGVVLDGGEITVGDTVELV